jgi:hypothetical protein
MTLVVVVAVVKGNESWIEERSEIERKILMIGGHPWGELVSLAIQPLKLHAYAKETWRQWLFLLLLLLLLLLQRKLM